jgi:hypothetical protein
MTNKAKKPFFKPKKFDDIENIHCMWHPHGNHTTGDYRIFIDRYTRKNNKGDNKELEQKKDEDDQGDKGF